MSNGRSYGDIKFAAIQEENEELRRRLKEVEDVQTREIQKNIDAMRSAEMCIKTLRDRLAKLEPVYTAAVACERDRAAEKEVSREHWMALFQAVERAQKQESK